MERSMRTAVGTILCAASVAAGFAAGAFWVVLMAIVGGFCIYPAMRNALDWVLIQAEKAEIEDQLNRGKDQV